MVQKDLKGVLNFYCDGTPDSEKESSVYESKEKCTAYNLKCVVRGNKSRVVFPHQIFFFIKI